MFLNNSQQGSGDLSSIVVVQSLSHVQHFATHGLQHARLPGKQIIGHNYPFPIL